MVTQELELIALPDDATLDLLAAARCIALKNPSSIILHPRRLVNNAWQFARKEKWFQTVALRDIQWESIRRVHLVGIYFQRQSPELIDQLLKLRIPQVLYSQKASKLPFHPQESRIKTHSFTSQLLSNLIKAGFEFEYNDAKLFLSAIYEKTWAGLASKSTQLDKEVLSHLNKFNIPGRVISNSIVLGLREGQSGVYYDLLKNTEEITVGNRQLTLILLKSQGLVQDLDPIMDSVWSEIAPHNIVIGIKSGSVTQFWARSEIPEVDFFEVFRSYRPRRRKRWITFKLSISSNLEGLKRELLEVLKNGLKPELCASDIMSVSPICVEENMTVSEALSTMLRFNIMSLVVVKDGKFSGLLTRRDLDRAIQMDLMQTPIQQYLPSSHPAISPNTPVRAIKNVMVRFNLSKLVVAENDSVLGIITSRELLRSLPDHMPLPAEYLPLTRCESLPDSNIIEESVKRVFSIKIFHLLKQIGNFAEHYGTKAFAVGGFVRDLLLEKQNLDIDIVVLDDAIPFARAISKELNCEYKIFDRFHTARIYLEDLKLDFSSARIEHYSDPGALPQIEFAGLSSDLYRRDFSINALALDLSPDRFLQLKDFFGGHADLKEKKVRTLHSFSFLEDPTRLFRALRFANRFHFDLEKDTRRSFELAIKKDAVKKLSLKRIGAEISRCLQEDQPHKLIEELFNFNLLQYLHPKLSDTSILPSRYRLIPGFLRRFAILDEEIDRETILWTGLLSLLKKEEINEILEKIGTTTERKRKILQSIDAMEIVPEDLSSIKIDSHFSIFELLEPLCMEALIVLMAFSLDKCNTKKVLYFIGNLRNLKCEINGKDLIEKGIKPGPIMRVIFHEILKKKIQGQLRNRKEELDYAIRLSKNI